MIDGLTVTLERLRFIGNRWVVGAHPGPYKPILPGMVLRQCNCMQPVPGTLICSGIDGLRFEECNLTNCRLPHDATRKGGLAVHVSLCSHEHPRMPGLPACAESCIHVDAHTAALEVDGRIVVDELWERSDKLLSRTPNTTGEEVVITTVAALEAAKVLEVG